MKIVSVETLVCNARMRNWVFVKVMTDQPGLYGWGEATLEWHTRSVVGAVEDLSHLLIGQDPTRIEYLWQVMYRQHFWHGNGIVRSTAIAGIDLALWDIAGKIAGVPCRSCGAARCGTGFVPTPTSAAGAWRTSTRRAPTTPNASLSWRVKRWSRGSPRSRRWRCRRRCPWRGCAASGTPRRTCRRCARRWARTSTSWWTAMRAPHRAMGLRFGEALEPYGLYFLEEPCWPESLEGLARSATPW